VKRKRLNKVKKPKKCPFCYSYFYEFRTYNGLLRHIINWHCLDASGLSFVVDPSRIKFLKVFDKTGSETYPVDGINEVEEFVKEYLLEKFNPSRGKSRLWDMVVENAKGNGKNC